MLCYTHRAVYSSAGLQRCFTTDHYTFMFASQLTHKLPINRNQKRRTLRAKFEQISRSSTSGRPNCQTITTAMRRMQIYAHEVYRAAAFLTTLFCAGFNKKAGFAAQTTRNPQRANACILSVYHPVMATKPLDVASD